MSGESEIPAAPGGALPSHYELLGISNGAPEEAIRSAYRDLLLKYHPEVDPSPEAQARLKLISRAFETLSNPTLRAQYDASLVPSSQTPPGKPEKSEALQPPLDQEMERTTAFAPPKPDLDRTATFVPPKPSEVEENRRLAQELARRGIAPEEAAKLAALGTASPQPHGKTPPSPPLLTEIAPRTQFEPNPSIVLPPSRESSSKERAAADRLLTAANLARRRGQFASAERSCMEAIQLVPSDGSALELYGDVLQELGRVDDALAAYKRATEEDPTRQNAEKKYAELMLLQDRSIAMLQREEVVGNPKIAVFLSALFPGAGQFSKGQNGKGLLFAAIMAALVFAFFYTDYGMPGSVGAISPTMIAIIVVAVILYIYNLIDAASSRTKRGGSSGWDV